MISKEQFNTLQREKKKGEESTPKRVKRVFARPSGSKNKWRERESDSFEGR